MSSLLRILFSVTFFAGYGKSANSNFSVTLKGLDASYPDMRCEENNWQHTKYDGSEFNIDVHLEGEDATLFVDEKRNDEKRFALKIQLNSESPHQNYLGIWTCGLNEWLVQGEPYIRRLGIKGDEEKHRKSYTVNEGSAVKFECEAFAIAENVTFKWSIKPESKESNTTGLIDYSRWDQEDNIVEDHAWVSTYELNAPEGVTLNDRFVYQCHVEGKFGSNTDSMLLRVKGKYAALWPAIGILIEVLIMGVGILIYEKKKKSKEASNEATSNNGDPSTSGLIHGGSGDVRKRTSVNT